MLCKSYLNWKWKRGTLPTVTSTLMTNRAKNQSKTMDKDRHLDLHRSIFCLRKITNSSEQIKSKQGPRWGGGEVHKAGIIQVLWCPAKRSHIRYQPKEAAGFSLSFLSVFGTPDSFFTPRAIRSTLSLSMTTLATGPNTWKYSESWVESTSRGKPLTNTLRSPWAFRAALSSTRCWCFRPPKWASKLGPAKTNMKQKHPNHSSLFLPLPLILAPFTFLSTICLYRAFFPSGSQENWPHYKISVNHL